MLTVLCIFTDKTNSQGWRDRKVRYCECLQRSLRGCWVDEERMPEECFCGQYGLMDTVLCSVTVPLSVSKSKRCVCKYSMTKALRLRYSVSRRWKSRSTRDTLAPSAARQAFGNKIQ